LRVGKEIRIAGFMNRSSITNRLDLMVRLSVHELTSGDNALPGYILKNLVS